MCRNLNTPRRTKTWKQTCSYMGCLKCFLTATEQYAWFAPLCSSLCTSGFLLYIRHSTCVKRIYTQVQTFHWHLRNNCGRRYVQNSCCVSNWKRLGQGKNKMRITRGSYLDFIVPGLKPIQLTITWRTNLQSIGFEDNVHMLMFKVTLLLLILRSTNNKIAAIWYVFVM